MRDGADCEPAYDLAFHDFFPFTRCRARPRSQQLILFSLDAMKTFPPRVCADFVFRGNRIRPSAAASQASACAVRQDDAARFRPNWCLCRKRGWCPIKETAIKVAEAISFRLYGEKNITARGRLSRDRRPEYLVGLRSAASGPGSSFAMAISRQTSAVLYLEH